MDKNNISDNVAPNAKPRTRRKLTKEEIAELMKVRAKLISTKGRYFKEVSEDAYKEWSEFHLCDKCKFVGKSCHKTCGAIMKHLHKIGAVDLAEPFGNGRATTEAEFTDTTAVNLGLDDSVDHIIADEINREFTDNIDYIEQLDYNIQDNG